MDSSMILLFPFLIILFIALGLLFAHIGGSWAYEKYQHTLAYFAGFAIVLVLVFGDEVFGHLYWQHLCKTEGGLHVYKKVPVEGFLYNDGSGELTFAKEFLDKGYQYVEGRYAYYDKDRSKPYRFTLDASGELVYTQINEPQSKYMYKHETVSYPHFVWSYQSTIRLVKTNELIGIHRDFGTHGGVVMKFLRHLTGAEFEGSADYCGINYSDVINATIPPIQSKTLKNGSK
jgi:hypothetical protein